MKNTNKFGELFRKVLSVVLILAVVISFSQPLNAEAKAKVNKVKLDKLGFTLDNELIQNTAKPLKKGKNKVTVWFHTGTVYQGYSKFVAPKTKTYKIKLSGLKGKKNAGLVLGHVGGSFIDGKTMTSVKIYNKNDRDGLTVGSKDVGSSFRKECTGSIKLEEGQALYLFYHFSSSKKGKNVSVDVTIK